MADFTDDDDPHQVIGTPDDDRIFGRGGNDTLEGRDGDDTLMGEDGNDVLYGGGTLGFEDFTTRDVLDGGVGIDTAALDYEGLFVVDPPENPPVSVTLTFSNTSFMAQMNGFPSATVNNCEQLIFLGPDGDDSINASQLDDFIDANGGDDTINGLGGNDDVSDTFGIMAFNGGGGTDKLAIDRSFEPAAINLNGPAGTLFVGGVSQGTFVNFEIMNVVGTSFNDTIIGLIASDIVLRGLDGDDSIRGGNGADVQVRGEGGDDTLDGLGGNDFLIGEEGTDAVRGGNGNDIVRALVDSDVEAGEFYDGGAGTDRFEIALQNQLSVNFGTMTVQNFEQLTDVTVGGSIYSVTFLTSQFNQFRLVDIPGHTTIKLSSPGAVAIGGKSITIETLQLFAGGQSFNGTNGIFNGLLLGGGGADTVTGTNNAATVFNANLGGGNDRFTGAGSRNQVAGGSGNDTATGTAVNDTLSGDAGLDSLAGGGGADSLNGGSGADTMNGGVGLDSYFVDNSGDRVFDTPGAERDTVRTSLLTLTLGANVENLVFAGLGNFVGKGNAAANQITGGTGADRFLADAAGADSINGAAGNDTMDYRGAGKATINLATNTHGGSAAGDVFTSVEAFFGSDTAGDAMTGGAARDTFVGFGGHDGLNGGGNNDFLAGGAGNDTLVGGAGADTLQGGLNNDRMTGGLAADRFLFAEAAFGKDTITDFADNADKLRMTAAIADSIADFTITGNGTTTVTLALAAAPAHTIKLQGAAPITITATDFDFV